jgi:hypothetical protein
MPFELVDLLVEPGLEFHFVGQPSIRCRATSRETSLIAARK